MTPLPTGTVSFLFADIESSTRLLDQLGPRYEDALEDERAILRSAAARCGGHEVDVQGDACFLAFGRASDAVRAAVDAQRAIGERTWPGGASLRVRMGLHTGEARLTDAGYVGMDVHRAARICAAGHGGQVLLSQTTRDLVEHELEEGVWLRDLGEHVLKDLRYPEHLFQLVVSDLPSEFGLLDSLSDRPHNLPLQFTSFVGRSRELEALKTLLARERLVTVCGPGGVGKTRLALQVAAELTDRFRDGVWHVDGTSLTSPELLVGTTARALRVMLGGLGVDTKTELLDYLGHRSLLIVMDNFELLAERAAILLELLERAPDVRILVTSRERLNLSGEWIVELDGLPFSESDDFSAATRLFLDRAQHVDRELAPSTADLRAVGRICRLVDGMPLAVELAAPWVSVLSCAEIADEIERTIDFLKTTMRDVPVRHRSLRAVFDRSWSMLDEREQDALGRLAVFSGGFRREAALEAAGVEDLSVLEALVRKSLLQHGADDRFSVHQIVRQYAEEKLEATGEAAVLRDRHAGYYTRFVAERGRQLVSEQPLTSRDEVVAELGNVRLAASHAVTAWSDDRARAVVLDLSGFGFTQNPGEAATIFDELVSALEDRGLPPSGAPGSTALAAAIAWRGYFEGFNGLSSSEDVLRESLPSLRASGLRYELALCLLDLGMMAYLKGEYDEAAPALEESLALCRSEGADLVTGACLLWLGWLRQDLGDSDAAGALYREAYELSERSHIGVLRAYTLSKLGMWADGRREYAEAWSYHDQARAAFESLENDAGRALALSRMSVSAWGLGDFLEAERLGCESLELFSDVGHRWGIPACHCRIGFARLGQGRVPEARASFEEGLRLALRSDMIAVELYAIIGLGAVLAREQEAEPAVELLAFALRHPATPDDYKVLARQELDTLEGALPVSDFARARSGPAELEEVIRSLLADPGTAPTSSGEPVAVSG